MSERGKKQGQSQSLPSVPADRPGNEYDAAAETDDSNHDKESEEAANLDHESSPSVGRKRLQQFVLKMYFIFKEVAIMFLLAFTYAALTNDPPKVSKSPAAFPFFPKTSIITDWYRGQLSMAIDKARESDIAFVMFYAPWDAESQAVRQEFDLAARYMQHQVTFAAVNCWQPGSECRRQYSKAYNWPVLIAYPSHGKGIQYKGPRTAAHIVKFLIALSRPLIRVMTESEVHGLLTSYDAVIVGCVNALPGSFEYAVLYTAALRFLEKDPFQEVAFAVLTGPTAGCFDAAAPSLTLHMWNETLWYPSEEEWKPDALLTWILKNLHQVSMWITPTGSKSLALSAYVQPGPALLLFTPRNPLDLFVDYYDLLHEIGLEYYNCGDKERVMLNSHSVYTKRAENYLKHTYLQKSCSLKPPVRKQTTFPSVVTYTVTNQWANNSCCLSDSILPKDTCLKCEAMDLLKKRLPAQCELLKTPAECIDIYKDLPKAHSNHKACERGSVKFKGVETKIQTSMIEDEYDPRAPRNLQKLWKREKCRIANIAHTIHSSPFSQSLGGDQNLQLLRQNIVNVSGFACKTNASLTLIALDSLKYYHFAEQLGLDLSKKTDRTTAVIINEKMETNHLMQEPVNDKTLREFIFNFTTSTLPRSYSSVTSIEHKHTHVYPHQTNCYSKQHPNVCLLELNTGTFLPTVMQQDKAVIVLYYSKQCSFCNGISYTFLAVANIFSSIGSIQFTRIDGDLNILPWEFTMDRYPTVIFFPARRKSESRVFPRSIPITVPNFVSFILANLDSSLKLHAMWTLCNETMFEDEKEACIASVRAENLSIIGHTLRAWRNADLLTRTKLLYKLQQLRHLNLLLAHSPSHGETIQTYMTRLHLAASKEMQQAEKGYESNRSAHVKEEL